MANKIISVNLSDFLSCKFPPARPLLGKWLTESSLSMVHAARGSGKTHFSLGVALAVATGGEFLGWKAKLPARVLFFDGEMSGTSLQNRLSNAIVAAGVNPIANYFMLLTRDLNGGILPDLSTVEGQRQVEHLIEPDHQLIVIDNLSSLCRSGRENESESWTVMADWLMRLRSNGHAVLLVHHSGKSGMQRGTSKREDILDCIIRLSLPHDYQSTDGCRFIASFEKDRHGQGCEDFEARLMPDGKWDIATQADTIDAQILELALLGMTHRDIASELGCNASTVCRKLKQAEADGRYVPPTKRKKASPTQAGNVVDFRRAGDD